MIRTLDIGNKLMHHNKSDKEMHVGHDDDYGRI